MRLIALLSWYDERTDWLAELVASMARAGVDHVVAVDGAYALYPQAGGTSGSQQAQVVTACAVGAGMGVTIHVPQGPWIGNEVEKRSALFSLGGVIAEPGTDWFWVCDADEVIAQAAGVREQLERSDLAVAEVLVEEHVAQGAYEWNRAVIRKLFRAHPAGIRVEHHHARYVNGDGDVLEDRGHPLGQVEAKSLWDVKIHHRPGDREEYRTAKRLSYYETRRNLAIEVG